MRDFHLGVRDRLRGAVQLLGLGCLLILYTARVAAADSCQGLVIDSVLLSGCQNTKCEQQQYYTKFIRLTDIEVKKTLYSKALIESIVKRFIKTGFFREVKVRCQRRDGHARVTFDVFVEFGGAHRVLGDIGLDAENRETMVFSHLEPDYLFDVAYALKSTR